MRTAPLFTAATSVVLVASTAHASSVFATYDASGYGGSLNGVGFTISASLVGSGPFTWDMSSNAYDNAGTQDVINYFSSTSTFTITFDQAVSDLEMYLADWRMFTGSGWTAYQFSESFVTNSGFVGSTSGGNTVDTTGDLTQGILRFTGPVTTLTVTGVGPQSSTAYSGQSFALAQNASTPAVPGVGGLAAIAGVGLAGRRRRR